MRKLLVVLCCLVALAALVFFGLPHFVWPPGGSTAGKNLKCNIHVIQLALTLDEYAAAHGGARPASLEALVGWHADYGGIVPRCPFHDSSEHAYVYFPPDQRAIDRTGKPLILYCRAPHPDTIHSADGETHAGTLRVVRPDLMVESIPVNEFKVTIDANSESKTERGAENHADKKSDAYSMAAARADFVFECYAVDEGPLGHGDKSVQKSYLVKYQSLHFGLIGVELPDKIWIHYDSARHTDVPKSGFEADFHEGDMFIAFLAYVDGAERAFEIIRLDTVDNRQLIQRRIKGRKQNEGKKTNDVRQTLPRAATVPSLQSMRARDEKLFTRISNVKTGMTKAEVSKILGEPSRREDDQWHYAISPPVAVARRWHAQDQGIHDPVRR